MRRGLKIIGLLPFGVHLIFCIGIGFLGSLIWSVAIPLLITLFVAGHGLCSPDKKWRVAGWSSLILLTLMLCYLGFNNDYFYLSEVYIAGFYFIYFSLSTHIDHTRLYRSDFYNISCVRSMNHLTISDINTTMRCCCYNITRLRVTYSCPSHECKCCSETAIASCQTIAYKSGTVETVWSACTPYIRFSKLAVCSAYD